MVTMNCVKRPFGALTLFAFFSAWTTAVNGQRLKEGCYDAAKLSCEDPPQIDAAREFGLDVNAICYQIEVDIFLTEEIVWDSTTHAEYLNGIESDAEFCDQIRIAYSQCLFCKDEEFVNDCENNAYYTKCGMQPTLEEVLQDDTVYAQFVTQADIDATCDALEIAYMDLYPSASELCERQTLVKHLCPGFCDGGCFDAELYPPTCDPDAFRGERNKTLDTSKVCSGISQESFFYVGGDTVMNVSAHLDYLKVIPMDNENTTWCNDVRQSYSECVWCSNDGMCFDESNPPSCRAPTDNVTSMDVLDIEEECISLYGAFYDLEKPDELYNISKHAFHLHVPANTTMCDRAKQAYHKCYWCVPEDVPVEFCDWGTACSSNLSLPEDHLSSTLMKLNITTSQPELNCDGIFDDWNTTWSNPFSLRGCYEDIFLAQLCPDQFCPEVEAAKEIDKDYLGATTTSQKRALIWMSRVAAFLTFFGATYILYDIFSHKKKLSTVYHRLLVGMAVFDIVTALAWCFATAPIDEAVAGHVEGAMGNEATCKAQAFFIQLGFSSVFYNVSLALYYVLVVVYDWKEFHLKKIQHYLMFLPPMVGLALALGGITSYHWLEYGCHILPPPEGELWPVLLFVVLPLGLSIAAITALMLVVYCKVRRQAATTRKWSFGVGRASALEQAVFWQCLFYVTAFYVTWPILFSVYLASIDVEGPLGLTLVVAFVAPLQGFTNFLVYLRPQLKKRWSDRNRSVSTSQSRATTVFLFARNTIMRRTHASTMVEDSTKSNQNDNTNGFMDPSAALAQETVSGEDDESRNRPLRLSTLQEDASSRAIQCKSIQSVAEGSSDINHASVREWQGGSNDEMKVTADGYFDTKIMCDPDDSSSPAEPTGNVLTSEDEVKTGLQGGSIQNDAHVL